MRQADLLPWRPGQAVAYDLALAGQRRWESGFENARIVMPLAADGSTVVMAANMGLIRFNLADGSVASITSVRPRWWH